MNIKDVLLAEIEKQARDRLGALAHELAQAGPETDTELILAEKAFEKWLADGARECLDDAEFLETL